MLIFLDFDGVLRRNGSPSLRFDDDCLATFEAAMRSLPKARIVITSSWRCVESLSELRNRFSPDIALRIIGATPLFASSEDHTRHREVLAYLEQNGLAGEAWIAVDDDPLNYPKPCPVLLTDGYVGFDEKAASELNELEVRVLRAMEHRPKES